MLKGKLPEVHVFKDKSRRKRLKIEASSACDNVKTNVQALNWALDKTSMKVYVRAGMDELAERKDKDGERLPDNSRSQLIRFQMRQLILLALESSPSYLVTWISGICIARSDRLNSSPINC